MSRARTRRIAQPLPPEVPLPEEREALVVSVLAAAEACGESADDLIFLWSSPLYGFPENGHLGDLS